MAFTRWLSQRRARRCSPAGQAEPDADAEDTKGTNTEKDTDAVTDTSAARLADPASQKRPRKRRRWLTFSLRTFLLASLAIALAMGVLSSRAFRQRNSLRRLRAVEADIVPAYQAVLQGDSQSGYGAPRGGGGGYLMTDGVDSWGWDQRITPPAQRLRNWLGDEWCDTIVCVGLHHSVDREVNDATAAPLSGLPDLKFLWLNGTLIGDRTAARIGGLKKLRAINLAETKITDDGLAALVRLPELRWLSLQNTAISDAGLQLLEQASALRVLEVQGTRVTAAGLQRLQAALPDCKIHSTLMDVP